ncbi:MAG: hypothetical protein H0Z24_08405 [Thermosipho sp. (in: Bacteria)]|nr:hypothetical protein [Thermosipho sp. (in: thermotogales)]
MKKIVTFLLILITILSFSNKTIFIFSAFPSNGMSLDFNMFWWYGNFFEFIENESDFKELKYTGQKYSKIYIPKVSYNIYFGNSPNSLKLVKKDYTQNTLEPDWNIENNKDYYWKIEIFFDGTPIYSSDILHFKTSSDFTKLKNKYSLFFNTKNYFSKTDFNFILPIASELDIKPLNLIEKILQFYSYTLLTPEKYIWAFKINSDYLGTEKIVSLDNFNIEIFDISKCFLNEKTFYSKKYQLDKYVDLLEIIIRNVENGVFGYLYLFNSLNNELIDLLWDEDYDMRNICVCEYFAKDINNDNKNDYIVIVNRGNNYFGTAHYYQLNIIYSSNTSYKVQKFYYGRLFHDQNYFKVVDIDNDNIYEIAKPNCYFNSSMAAYDELYYDIYKLIDGKYKKYKSIIVDKKSIIRFLYWYINKPNEMFKIFGKNIEYLFDFNNFKTKKTSYKLLLEWENVNVSGYDLYIGYSKESLKLIASNLKNNRYNLIIKDNKPFYWKVFGKDSEGNYIYASDLHKVIPVPTLKEEDIYNKNKNSFLDYFTKPKY